MLRFLIPAVLLCGFLLTGCGVVDVLDGIAEPGDTFQVEETHCVGLGSEAFVLHFAEVLSDDRCRAGTSCERPGEARVRVRFLREVGDPLVRVFEIAGFVDAEDVGRHTTFDLGAFRVTLLQLDPNPSGADTTAAPVATFLLRPGV